jgi:hypothetical protein
MPQKPLIIEVKVKPNARTAQVAAGGWQGQRGIDWFGREALRLP